MIISCRTMPEKTFLKGRFFLLKIKPFKKVFFHKLDKR